MVRCLTVSKQPIRYSYNSCLAQPQQKTTSWQRNGAELAPVVDLDCGAGTIIRRFQAVDAFGNLSLNLCQQTVTVSGVHEYEIKFRQTPMPVCGVAEPDSVIYEEIGCDLLAVNHTDEFFSASGDECYKDLPVSGRWSTGASTTGELTRL